jgi:hypothetical protein
MARVRLGAWSYAPTEVATTDEFALFGLPKGLAGQPPARPSLKICLDWDSNGAELTSRSSMETSRRNARRKDGGVFLRRR